VTPARATRASRVARASSALAVFVMACASPVRPRAPVAMDAPDPIAVAAPPRREVPLGQLQFSRSDAPPPDADTRGQLFSALQAMRACWPARGARLAIELLVGASGNVVDARIVGDDDHAARCVQNALIGWRYAGTGEALHVTATLLVEPEAHRPGP
jgi:hypothetical protein